MGRLIHNNNDKGGFKKSLSMIEAGSTRAMRGKNFDNQIMKAY
jgi:hypothetical protein